MQLDSSAIYVLIKELKKSIMYSQVRKIHQTDNRTIIMELFRPTSSPIKLIISSASTPLIYTQQEHFNFSYTPAQNFCMSLRKHLEGSKLTDITQINLDRVVKISFSRIETAGEIKIKELYVELIPSTPNIILTENDTILDACLKGNKKNRLILSQEKYTLPGNNQRMDFTQFNKIELLSIIKHNKDCELLPKELIFKTFNGFSEILINELFTKNEFFFKKQMNELNDEEINKIVETIYNFKFTLENSSYINLYETKTQYILSPIKYKKIENDPILTTVNNSIINYIENYKYFNRSEILKFTKEIKSILKKENKKLKKIDDELKETEKMEIYKLWGNLLTIYAHQKTHYKEFIIVKNIFNESQDKIKIPIIKEKTLLENSQIYFKKYNKLKTRMNIGREKLENCKEKIYTLNHLLYYSTLITSEDELNNLKDEMNSLNIKRLNNTKNENKKNKAKIFNNNFLTFTIDGFKVLIGKNSKENEIITFKKSSKDDIWLHAKQIPGSHVIIKAENQIIPFNTLEKVASITAFYSSGKNSNKLTIDYTFIKNVKKIPGAKQGHVSYTNEKSLVVIPRSPDYFINK